MKDKDIGLDPYGPYRELDALNAQLLAALKAIAVIGGNLPDDRLTDRSGPNDAAQRGIMYCNAREIAREAIKAAETEHL